MTIQERIKKLQELPEPQKKIIFFIAMGVSVLIIGVLGFFITKNNIIIIGKSVQSVRLPNIDTSTNVSMPNMDMTNVISGVTSAVSQDQNSTGADTSHWQTYTNVKYGFEIQYPMNYTVNVDPPSFNFSNTAINNEAYYDFQIFINDKESFIAPNQSKLSDAKVSNLEIGGFPVYFSKSNPNMQYVLTDKNVFQFIWQSSSDNVASLILSTFKFTNQ